MIFRDLLGYLEDTPNVSVLSSEDVLADDANTIVGNEPSKFSVAPRTPINPYNLEAMDVFLQSLAPSTFQPEPCQSARPFQLAGILASTSEVLLERRSLFASEPQLAMKEQSKASKIASVRTK